MNYKRSKIMNGVKSTDIALMFCGFIIVIGSIFLWYYTTQNTKLSQENAEYLSVIEEYSVEYSELESKLMDCENNIQDYRYKIKQYKEQINKYKSQINKYKATAKVYEIENERYKEQLEAVYEADDTDTTEVEYQYDYDYDYDYVADSFTGNITGYCGCEECCGVYATDDEVKYGATGMELISGYSVASDYYDMGTILYIEGYGEVQVADRFGAGHSKEYIDIYFTTHSEAWDWGRQYLTVSVVS